MVSFKNGRPRPLLPRKSKGRRESQVQAGILSYLETRKDIVFWRQNTGAAKYGDFYVQFGLRGAADIQGIQAVHGRYGMIGRFFGIESKREVGGKVSKDQLIWGENVMMFGGLYVVARSIETVIAHLGPEHFRIQKLLYRKRVYS